jgi:hypothetical protein
VQPGAKKRRGELGVRLSSLRSVSELSVPYR